MRQQEAEVVASSTEVVLAAITATAVAMVVEAMGVMEEALEAVVEEGHLEMGVISVDPREEAVATAEARVGTPGHREVLLMVQQVEEEGNLLLLMILI
jgi:hypothetical protein